MRSGGVRGAVGAEGSVLNWEGCVNVRDLGGLPAGGGRTTRPRALVRSGAVDTLTKAGWAKLTAYGVRTIVDLRNDDERRPDRAPRPRDVVTLQVSLDGIDDREFWDRWQTGPQFGTPLYYRPFLDRFPQRTAQAVAAIADAEPSGGVLFHCQGGRDRSGLIALLLLALVGVAPDAIAADYALSDEGSGGSEFLATQGTSAPELITTLIAELDVEAYLTAAGVRPDQLAAIRARLLSA